MPPADGKCTQCGAEVVQRPDDARDVIERRLHEYHMQTEPLVEYYKAKGVLRDSVSCNNKDKALENTIRVLVMR